MDALALFVCFLVVAALAFANGSNDLSRAAATLVGSGAGHFKKTLYWGILWTLAGSLLSGVLAAGVGTRFAHGISNASQGSAWMVCAIGIGACIWVLLATSRAIPVSTTHAILGAILAVDWMSQGSLPWTRMNQMKGFFVPLLASPAIALICIFGARALWSGLQWRRELNSPTSPTQQLILDRSHWISSGLVGLSRGVNDSAKIWALLLPLAALAGRTQLLWTAVLVVAIAMALGSWIAGRRVTELLAHRVTAMDHAEGLMANASTALIIVAASLLGFPVASSHVIGGAIIGVGLTKVERQKRKVNWKVVLEMVVSWILTLPMAALFTLICCKAMGAMMAGQTAVAAAALLAFVLLVISILKVGIRSSSPRRSARLQPAAAAMAQRLFIFVCSGNTSRSPMAQAICSTELARRLGITIEQLPTLGVQVMSAGLTAKPGTPMTAEAQGALAELGVPAPHHQARNLDSGLASRATAIFCMTEEQRQKAAAMFPNAAAKIYRLDPAQDIADPSGQGAEAFRDLAQVLRDVVGRKLNDIGNRSGDLGTLSGPILLGE